MTPLIPERESSKIIDLISITHANITQIRKQYNHKVGTITIDAEYEGDITEGIIPVSYSSAEFNISYEPMVSPAYYSTEQCETVNSIEIILEVAQIMSYVMLFLGLILSCKIVGLELFGILQLAYFDLSHHDFFNIILSPLAKFKSFNGINISFSS